MCLSFPDSFDLAKFDGPRAKQFSNPGDAFQRLIGDALKEMTGNEADLNPLGKMDGGIDCFLIAGASLTGPFENISLPCIIECKSSGDAAKDVKEAILSDWSAVKSKLRKQAIRGWPKLAAPWKDATSYVYLLSANVWRTTKEKLKKEICGFFADLGEDDRPPITSVYVFTWGEIRPWLDGFPRIRDSWLGIGLAAIVDHDTYARRLLGFRNYLRESELKFVSPKEDAIWNPKALVATFEEENSEWGALLVGVGGVGKTRICFETAIEALSRGWRVLHVEPSEPGVTVEDLAKVVFPCPTQTLLIFDYLDQMEKFDLDAVRKRFLPEAINRGLKIAFLATCRPRWSRISSPEVNELLRVIEIRPTADHNEKIVAAIIDQVAPTASAQIGRNEVIRLAGSRPIIALLISGELERRVLSGDLENGDLETLKSSDLTGWLRRRFHNDPLFGFQSQSPLDRVPPEIVAAGAAMACAPGPEEALIRAARLTLTILNYDRPEDSKRLIDILSELGWLDRIGSRLAPAHDVVVDEVLIRVLLDATAVREVEFNALLAIVPDRIRSLGRFAVALRRVTNAIEVEDVAKQLEAVSASWMRVHAASLGEALSHGSPDTTGYSLASVISGPPWGEVSVELWDVLVGPWLRHHGDKEEARHLIYKGLKRPGPQCPPQLLDTALRWLAANPLRPTTPFVLGPMLERDDLGDHTTAAVGYALRWLEDFPRLDESVFVLRPLLNRQTLDEKVEKEVVRLSLDWLGEARRRNLYAAGLVLAPLLKGERIVGKKAKVVIIYATEWITRWRNSKGSWTLVFNLLRRPEVSNRVGEEIIESAIKQMRASLGDETLWLPLSSCFQREIGNENLASELLRIAIDWLKMHPQNGHADSVFTCTLRRRDLADPTWRLVSEIASRWLSIVSADVSRQGRILNCLLLRPSLLDRDTLHDLVRRAIAQLREEGLERERAQFLTTLRSAQPFLNADDGLSKQLATTLSSYSISEKDAVFDSLRLGEKLSNSALSDSEWRSYALDGLKWALSAPPTSFRLSQCCSLLCRRPELFSSDELQQVVRLVFELLQPRRQGSSRVVELLVEGLRKVQRKLPELAICSEIGEILANHPVSSFDEVLDRLSTAAENSAVRPTETLIKEGCDLTTMEGRRSPSRAVFALSPLLILGLRAGSGPLNAVREAAKHILSDRRLNPRARFKLAEAIREFLKQNPASSIEGKALLRDLGLQDE